jgi:hypothetical protein
MSYPKSCCITGVGNHSSANLIPALLRLQEEGKIKITKVCRKNVELGNAGLGDAEVTPVLPTDVDFIVACGSPELHKKAIDHSIATGIPVFVEKPHLVEDYPGALKAKLMIGYNFSFLPLPENFDAIECKSKGVYRAWPDLFPEKEKFHHAYHTVFVHPIAVVVDRYGKPDRVTVTDRSADDYVTTALTFHYSSIDGSGEEANKVVLLTTKGTGFEFNVTPEFGTESIPMKEHKAGTYYKMLSHFVDSGFTTGFCSGEVGKIVLDIINQAIAESGNTTATTATAATAATTATSE